MVSRDGTKSTSDITVNFSKYPTPFNIFQTRRNKGLITTKILNILKQRTLYNMRSK